MCFDKSNGSGAKNQLPRIYQTCLRFLGNCKEKYKKVVESIQEQRWQALFAFSKQMRPVESLGEILDSPASFGALRICLSAR